MQFKKKATPEELEKIVAMYREQEARQQADRKITVQDAGKPKVVLPGPGGGEGAAFYKDDRGVWVKYKKYEKQEGKPDLRTVKHSFVDSTNHPTFKKFIAPAVTLWGVYKEAVDYNLLPSGLPTGEVWFWVALMLGVGWWIILFVIQMIQKSSRVIG